MIMRHKTPLLLCFQLFLSFQKMKLTIDIATYYDEVSNYEREIQFFKMELANSKKEANLAANKLKNTKLENSRLDMENKKLQVKLKAFSQGSEKQPFGPSSLFLNQGSILVPVPRNPVGHYQKFLFRVTIFEP